MLLRRRLMCLKSKTNPVQHYDEDGNAYDAEGLGINLSMALSNDSQLLLGRPDCV